MVRTWPGDNGSGTVAGRAAGEIVRAGLVVGFAVVGFAGPDAADSLNRPGEPASRRKRLRGVAQPRRWASSEAG